MRFRASVRIAGCAVAAVALAIAIAAPASAGRRPSPVDRTPPTQPTNLRVTATTQTSVTLTWTPSTDNVGVRSYSLWGEGLSGVVSATHPVTTATWSSLRPGQTVTFRVTAFDAQYNSSTPSAPVTVTTVPDTTAPSAPSGLTVSSTTASTVLLTWNSGTDQFKPVRHEILVNGVPTTDAVSTVPPGTPPPSVQGASVRQLDPSTTYSFAVRAIDPSGNVSASSNTVSAGTAADSDTVAPTSPTLLSAFDGGNGSCPEELWLRWSAATDDVLAPSAIEYEVRVNGLINEVIPGGTQTVAYTDVLGANNVTIVAVDRAGNASAPSNTQTVITNWAPGGCGM
jgi:hypothetical protein